MAVLISELSTNTMLLDENQSMSDVRTIYMFNRQRHRSYLNGTFTGVEGHL